MRSQTGSAAKSIMILTLVIAGALAMYMGMFNAKQMEPEGGQGASFQPHDDIVRGELQRLPSQKPFTVSAAESVEMTHVDVNSPENTECDNVFLAQVYQTCSMHRVQSHRDSKCHVVLHYTGGECAQP